MTDRAAIPLLVLAALVGCSTPGDTAITLTATLVSPTDVVLEWTDRTTDAAGKVVEFATEPGGQYTILEFLPPDRKTYRHPDLIPTTRFHYRVRPYYGEATEPVGITLPPGDLTEEEQAADHEWATPKVLPGGPAATRSLKDGVAPGDLVATVMDTNGIKFTWTDRATDEEGYLLEVKPEGSAEYGAAAVLDPDVNSAGLVTLPNEKKASYRVRAFRYGDPSNVVTQETGEGPPDK